MCSRRSPTASPLTRSSLSSSMSLPLAPALLLLGLTDSVPIGQLKRMLLKTRNAASLELYYRRNPRYPDPSPSTPLSLRAPIRFECGHFPRAQASVWRRRAVGPWDGGGGCRSGDCEAELYALNGCVRHRAGARPDREF